MTRRTLLRSGVLLLFSLAATTAAARTQHDADPPETQTPEAAQGGAGAAPPPADSAIEVHGLDFAALADRTLGSASRPVRFDWRNATVGFGPMLGTLLELNNFESTRLGAHLRVMLAGLYATVGVNQVLTRGTDSSRKLARTPYRQHGRPRRIEVDVGLAYPLAEGIVTARPGFFPAVQMVLSANVDLRYLYYPGALRGAGVRGTAGALLSPTLTRREQEALKRTRPAGMQVESARLGLLVGFTADLYLRNGVFLFPRVLCSVPTVAAVQGKGLGLWWELTLGVGYALK